ncbi:alkaline phosphatase family protein [Saccharopolyspora rhizosphaerae]|uniref:Alkaline phosphatase family protein n=1 Tax=Saccharopolyspora rhizosphaerae TaxID=2492662 RepID=A0A3R8PAZ6_9PSEU|nr:alkaline phosphatase D family protein [Saccharopolyspora rhizosphaerae]RRO20610.1 alkaline phosphatase family protein [Saccharopolyspora rhizosphaerae]
MTELVLGPLLRFVDSSRATVWVETDAPCTVEVVDTAEHTFQVGGHHYALLTVHVTGPTPYQVRLDGRVVWPERDASPSVIRPVTATDRLTALFGSCHFDRPTSGRDRLGPDALTATASRVAGTPEDERPDVLLLLGDQVYADQTTPRVRRHLAAQRDLSRPPGKEVASFDEYALLYRFSWQDPPVRWLLSTLPSMMIFDDHDVRDDWNTSLAWRTAMSELPWWRERLLGGLVAYWIYQHIGNLDPDQLESDPVFREVREVGRHGDAMPVLRELAAQADREEHGEKGVRWSYSRDLGGVRLVVLDTRCGRILETDDRGMLSRGDFTWLREVMAADRKHLALASSLPWLLPHAVHHAQSWNERACTGRHADLAEKLRQTGDLEHWAAFRDSFDQLAELIGERGAGPDAPRTISVLSGDVHHSYLAEADYPRRLDSRVTQLTCSPLRNMIPKPLRAPLRAAWSKAPSRLVQRMALRAGVPPLPVAWRRTDGPFFSNSIAQLDYHGPHAQVTLWGATSDDALQEVCVRRLS